MANKDNPNLEGYVFDVTIEPANTVKTVKKVSKNLQTYLKLILKK